MKESTTSSRILKSTPTKASAYSMTTKLTTAPGGTFDAVPRGTDSDSACGVASGEGVGVAAGFGGPWRPDCARAPVVEAHRASDASASAAQRAGAAARADGGECGSFLIFNSSACV